jgi:hypothetical protein
MSRLGFFTPKRRACGLSDRAGCAGVPVRPVSPPAHAAVDGGLCPAADAVLYLPTLTAVRLDPLLERFFEPLVRAGTKMQVGGAGRRTLLRIGYGVLTSRTPFHPDGPTPAR